MTDSLPLLPCPFCGAHATVCEFKGHHEHRFSANCRECAAEGPESTTADEAAKRWNERGADADKARLDWLEANSAHFHSAIEMEHDAHLGTGSLREAIDAAMKPEVISGCAHLQRFTAREGDEFVIRCQHCGTELEREPFVDDGRLYGTPE